MDLHIYYYYIMLSKMFGDSTSKATRHTCTQYVYNCGVQCAHNNKWDLQVVRALLNLSARVALSSFYFCGKYIAAISFS